MKRWFIAAMGDYENEGTNVPAINKYSLDGQLRTDPSQPTVNSRGWVGGLGWMFGQLAASNLTLLRDDPDIYLIPDASLDNALSTVPGSARTELRNRLEAAGFSFTGVAWTWTVRQLLVFLRGQLQPALGNNIEDGDVKDSQ